ncbi:hypothetical protein [Rhodococcus pyridinivorans]|uniref:hypothetical protein n=1 Tax=Rhodococcus pyridinivorans TaxID=103816 RepID=UPI002078689A|nr:hypothetical protein [Rhodococcus pyridinivorans]USI93024.1 hypothetical protein LLA01_24265 [Rhodococcus pyridinivorans]
MSHRSRRVAAIVLTAAIAAGGISAGTQFAAAAPTTIEYRQNSQSEERAADTKTEKTKLKWSRKEIIEGILVNVIWEGIQSIPIPKSSGKSPEQAARDFVNAIPGVPASRVTTPASLVTFAKHAPGGPTNRVAYVRGNPDELFAAITRTGTRVNKNEYKVGTEKVTYKPGTKSAPPSITINNSVTSTKVIILA